MRSDRCRKKRVRPLRQFSTFLQKILNRPPVTKLGHGSGVIVVAQGLSIVCREVMLLFCLRVSFIAMYGLGENGTGYSSKNILRLPSMS